MLFVTFNDTPSGIYQSQVTDVVKFISTTFNQKVRLIAFISLRHFLSNRKKIKTLSSGAIVLPMIPGVKNWKYNRILFFFIALIFFRTTVITRGIFAFHIAYPFKRLRFIRNIILDARGAYKAEFEEYKVINDNYFIQQIPYLEKKALLLADFKIAVSQALINFWENQYQISNTNKVIIPCTLSSHFIKDFPNESFIFHQRKKLGFDLHDIIIVFSGSSSGWQSLQLSDKYLYYILNSNNRVKVLFLGNHKLHQYKIYQDFYDRIQQYECAPYDVLNYLYAADYGWLVREHSVTNAVSSPVKFAEYLAAGLKIIISEHIGDYSEFCKDNHCGIVLSEKNLFNIKLNNINYEEKIKQHQLAMRYFTKEQYIEEYRKIIHLK